MGNVHSVMQVEPWQTLHGAVLEITSQHDRVVEQVEGARESYVGIRHEHRLIPTPRGDVCIPGARTFVHVQSGGKWGYGDSFEQLLDRIAPHLRPSLFYVHDEHSTVIQYALDGHNLTVGPYATDTAAGVVLAQQRPEHRAFARKQLVDMLEDTWFFCTPDEPSVARKRALETLETLAPESWETRWQRGRWLLDMQRPADAVPLLEYALSCAPAEKRLTVGRDLFRAVNLTDPLAALDLADEIMDALVNDEDRLSSNENAYLLLEIAETNLLADRPDQSEAMVWAAIRSLYRSVGIPELLADIRAESNDERGAADLDHVARKLASARSTGPD